MFGLGLRLSITYRKSESNLMLSILVELEEQCSGARETVSIPDVPGGNVQMCNFPSS